MKLPSHTTIVAYAALLVALSGSAYAAIQLPARSVGTRELKDSAVTNTKVKRGSLLRSAFKSGQLPAGDAYVIPLGWTPPQPTTGPQAGPATVALQLDLPAGSYTYSGVVVASPMDQNVDYMFCSVEIGGPTHVIEDREVHTGGGGAYAVAPVSGGFTLTKPDTLKVACLSQNSGDFAYSVPTLVAVRVGTAHIL
jgi:hypothetical protein